MTRARAAAQAGTSSVKQTKIVTAAAKAKAARPATTATKRKLRSDETEHDEEHDELESQPQPPPQAAMIKATRPRGRPKKTPDSSAEAAVPEPADGPAAAPRSTRTRAAKTPAPEPPKAPLSRATRTARARRAQAGEDMELDAPSEPAKKVTRTRATSIAKPAVKKTVTFDEPEKENILPAAAKAKSAGKVADVATGLRAKPVRRAASASARSAKGSSVSAGQKGEAGPTPLSPRKVTQMRVSREARDTDSEDELGAVEKAPTKRFKGPLRPPVVLHGSVKEADGSPDGPSLGAPEIPTVILGSPARRPPPSPYKDAMRSPARRGEGAVSLAPSAARADPQSSQSPLKASLLQSPAKRPQVPIQGLEPSSNADDTIRSPFKMSLLQSPAKRPASPIKHVSLQGRSGVMDAQASPAPKPTLLATPGPVVTSAADDEDSIDQQLKSVLESMDHEGLPESPTRLRFPGRLSAVLPRHADPALKESMLAVPEGTEDDSHAVVQAYDEALLGDGDPMEVDRPGQMDAPAGQPSTIHPQGPPKRPANMFSLRQKDLDPYNDLDSESEDELAPRHLQYNASPTRQQAVPATPCPAGSSRSRKSDVHQAQSARPSTTKRLRVDKFGFTPLADQLGGWKANSPNKATPAPAALHQGGDIASPRAHSTSPGVEEPTMKPTFFDDEMSVRSPAITREVDSAEPDDLVVGEVESPTFDDVPITHEDVALAEEANEMSLMDPHQLDEIINPHGADDSVSDTSQEYGDENAIPIDPALLPAGESPSVPPVTPQRFVTRTFHTVSKVPLKPADESTPRPVIRKRSQSISRLPTAVQRPSRGLTRNATVISYSPSKKDRQQATFEEAVRDGQEDEQSRAGSAPPVTPSKSEAAAWSTAGTPARTPCRDVDPALLRGAVVFVDVHTTEGADASGIFVELLTQMGARCIKNWSWNPTSPPGKDGSLSKIGITHVVYKDGGKRTMEKVRETGGVVQCVGVSWVLE